MTLYSNETDLRSQRAAERVGFLREGHKRQMHRSILCGNGSYSGDYIYGLLMTEYRQRV